MHKSPLNYPEVVLRAGMLQKPYICKVSQTIHVVTNQYKLPVMDIHGTYIIHHGYKEI
jgi:hypothetical protein